MKNQIKIQALLAIVAFGMMFTSCGNIDIVKRRYRPGFHVDVSKKTQQTKPAEEVAVADARKVEKGIAIEAKKVKKVDVKLDEPLTADAESATPSSKLIKEKKDRAKVDEVLQGFKNLDFKTWVRDAKNGIRPDKSAVSGDDWMSWVSFGTGLGALVFGFLALLFGILFGWSYFVWFALLLAAAAIVFAFLHKKKSPTLASKAKLGLIFGIIGGGLAIIALMVWLIYIGAAITPIL